MPESGIDELGFVPAVVLLKYEAFVNAYLSHGSGRQAAKDAGYECPSDNAYDQLAHRLLKHPDVLKILRSQIQSLRVKNGVTAERTWAELARIAFFDPGELLTDDGKLKSTSEMTEDARRCIAQVKVKTSTSEDSEYVEREVKTYDKLAALKELLKLQGLS
ncbi:MAG TPA: terminase small subunit, partial [Lysobacter sp.]|nr:terminase small subunit [Lysobacter sp.]